MRNKFRYILFIYVVVLLFASCKSAAVMSREKGIDDIVASYNADDKPGASVLVFQNDKIIFKKGYGYKSVASKEKITPATNFRLASVTKQFTAMSILLLAEKGRLKLEDPISKFFSNFPAYAKSIKVKHLLTHTSGLIDYEDLIPATKIEPLHDTNCLQLMYTANKLYFPAGTQYKYSNTGYAILALIVEKVSGQDFAVFLKENIFTPLKMKTTIAFEQGKSDVVNRAYGHSIENGTWVQTDQNLTSAVLGDGGIYSNTVELSNWIKALWNNTLLRSDIQNETWTRKKLNSGKEIDYGYGWHIEEFNNITHPYHDGSSIGFRNSILVFPTQKLMVVILTNRNEGDPSVEAKKIAALFLN